MKEKSQNKTEELGGLLGTPGTLHGLRNIVQLPGEDWEIKELVKKSLLNEEIGCCEK